MTGETASAGVCAARAFSGAVSADGMLRAAGDVQPEEYLGCRVLVSGYVADRDVLRARFGPATSPRATDAELLAHAFRTWGGDVQAHVSGEYTAVVFDIRARSALFAHDALGMGQLFYARRNGGVAFATDVLDLVDAAACASLDDEYLTGFLASGIMTGERTPYPSIRRLLPGQSLWWSDGDLRALKTWDLARLPPVSCRDDGEYDERFRALLSAGVRAARDPAGPTWISLSGGLDSSSVACIAARDDPRDLAAYSSRCSRWSAADEERWMRAVVERCELPWHTLDAETMLPFSRLPGAFHGEPTQSVIGEHQLQAENELLRSHGARVMLTGHGGDSALCASPGDVPPHLADALFDANPPAALRALSAWRNGARDGRSQSYWLLRGLVQPALDHVRGRSVQGGDTKPLAPWFARDFVRTMRPQTHARRNVAPRCRQPGRQALANALWMMAMTVATIPQRRMTYAMRSPLLYRPLVEFMCGIPWEQKLRPRCDRYLQRRALAGVLPELVRRRASKANGSPAMVEGLRRSRDWQAYLCDTPLLAQRGFVDADAWRLAVKRAAVGQTYDDRFFMAAVAVEAWLKQLAEHRAHLLSRAPGGVT